MSGFTLRSSIQGKEHPDSMIGILIGKFHFHPSRVLLKSSALITMSIIEHNDSVCHWKHKMKFWCLMQTLHSIGKICTQQVLILCHFHFLLKVNCSFQICSFKKRLYSSSVSFFLSSSFYSIFSFLFLSLFSLTSFPFLTAWTFLNKSDSFSFIFMLPSSPEHLFGEKLQQTNCSLKIIKKDLKWGTSFPRCIWYNIFCILKISFD